ncbi:MAG: TIGR02300 family protein [Rhodospirillales bacterium]
MAIGLSKLEPVSCRRQTGGKFRGHQRTAIRHVSFDAAATAFRQRLPALAIASETKLGGGRVAKTGLGIKHTCQNCGRRFYDLDRAPPVCPRCGTKLDAAPPPKPRRPSKPAVQKPKPAAAPVKTVAAAEIVKALRTFSGEGEDDDGDKDGIEKILNEETDLKEIEKNETCLQEVGNGDDHELIEDTSDLGEDDDDVSEVMEHVDEGVEDKT